MGRIRIVMSGLPVMLSDILQRAISRDPELETVANLGERDDPAPALADLEADVVIIGESLGSLSSSDVFRAWPGAHVAKLSRSGRIVSIWSRGEQCMSLEGASPDHLLQVLKCLAAADAGPR